MFSPNHRSRFQRCPVCAKDVHKVLLQQHVEVCLERSAGGASSGAGDASAGGWGRPRDSARGDAVSPAETSGRERHAVCRDGKRSASDAAAPFVAAGAFGTDATNFIATNNHNPLPARTPFAALRESTDGRGPFRRAGDATCASRSRAAAERRSVGPLGGFFAAKAKRRKSDQPSLDVSSPPSGEDARGRAPSLFLGADFERSRVGADGFRLATDPPIPEGPEASEREGEEKNAEDENDENENENENVPLREENDARGERDADVERRRAESAVAVGDGGLMPFPVRVMSGDHRDCGICLQRFDAESGVERHVLWPCQHARQCGDCAIRIWQVPKSKRRCPWCKSKIDIRPRPFKPFL